MTAEADAAAGGEPVKAENEVSQKKEKKMTKRQKRKQVNEKNKWPQHPKIQDMEVRNKAYVRVAGLGTSSKQKESIDPKLDLMSPEVKFGRLLGGTDQRKRHAAVQKLKAYLRARCDIDNENGGISEIDLLKLWKGLWYTLYMADKVPVQEELSKHLADLMWCVAGTEEEDEYAGQAYMEMCEEEDAKEEEDDDDDDEVILEEIENTLDADNEDEDESEEDSDNDGEDMEEEDEDEHADAANDNEDEVEGKEEMEEDDHDEEVENDEEADTSEIPHCRGAHLASLFIRTFFRTMRREWGNMDKYRVDKFYTLSRLYMHEIFKYMATRHWNIGIIRMFNDAIFEEVLSQKPNGLRYHLIDVVLDELAKANAEAPLTLTEATFLDTLEPYFAMCQTGAGDHSVQQRVLENVLEKFLEKYSFVSDAAISEDEADGNGKRLIFDEVHVGTVSQFIFDIASDPSTKDMYRKSLYDLHKRYARRLKKVGRDVVLDGGEEAEDDIEDHPDDESHDVDEVVREAEGEDETPSEEDDVPPTKKEKKRLRQMDEDANPTVQPSKKKKKKQGKCSKSDCCAAEKCDETPVALDNQEKSIVDEKKKSKKKKKSKRDKGISVEKDEEEVVTITLSDQKKAKVEATKKKRSKSDEKGELKLESTSSKRVKWLPSNKTKSYKASMKGLFTANPPKTSEVTPEKSILLNKGKLRRAGVQKSGRKRAISYF